VRAFSFFGYRAPPPRYRVRVAPYPYLSSLGFLLCEVVAPPIFRRLFFRVLAIPLGIASTDLLQAHVIRTVADLADLAAVPVALSALGAHVAIEY
jgi:hypothetical protein